MARSQSFVSDIEGEEREFSRSTVMLVLESLASILPLGAREPFINAGLGAAEFAAKEDRDVIGEIGIAADIGVFARIPVSGRATGSMNRLAETPIMYESALDMMPNNVRAIELSGDSMEPHYSSGDILFIQESKEAHDGDEVIAVVGPLDGVTCKVYRNDPEEYLEPYNGEGKITDFIIVGIVTGYFRRKRRKI